MENWRTHLCGSLALRPAAASEAAELDLNALKQLSDRMSCGGVYFPNWNEKMLPAKSLEPQDQKLRTVHLAGQEKERAAVLLITEHKAANQAKCPALHSDSPALFDALSANTSAMLREIDNLWHKN